MYDLKKHQAECDNQVMIIEQYLTETTIRKKNAKTISFDFTEYS